MDLDQMKLAAQEAFVNKKITAKYFHQWSPERVLKLLAVLEAARAVRDEVIEEVETRLEVMSPHEKLLNEAFLYLDTAKDDDQKVRVEV